MRFIAMSSIMVKEALKYLHVGELSVLDYHSHPN
jgi:hypothetical protein